MSAANAGAHVSDNRRHTKLRRGTNSSFDQEYAIFRQSPAIARFASWGFFRGASPICAGLSRVPCIITEEVMETLGTPEHVMMRKLQPVFHDWEWEALLDNREFRRRLAE